MVKLRPRFRRPNHATHLIWWQMSSIAIIVEAIWLDIILQVSTCGDLTSWARRLGLELAPILSQADVAIYRIYSPFCAKGCKIIILSTLKVQTERTRDLMVVILIHKFIVGINGGLRHDWKSACTVGDLVRFWLRHCRVFHSQMKQSWPAAIYTICFQNFFCHQHVSNPL